MKFPLTATLLLSAFTLHPSSLLAQGTLTPPSAPAPMMKSLDQIEARTPISSLPITITDSGSYYLTSNFVVGSGVAININTDSVTLDLNGFTITSTNNPAGGFGIQLNGHRDITVQNGHLQGGVTYSGGTYSGPGFLMGINAAGGCQNVRVSGVSVSGCLQNGINLGTDHSIVVESCTVQTVGGTGISAATVSHCTAYQCGSFGIVGNTVSDCYGYGTGIADGVHAFQVANNCYGQSTGSGVGVNAGAANNCQGASDSGNGITANAANNCLGVSTSGVGITATSATGCSGQCLTNNIGLTASVANNCYGQGGNGGIQCVVANNCYGTGTQGAGLDTLLANGSYGNSVAGRGLSAIIANYCYGVSQNSPGIYATDVIGCFGSSYYDNGITVFAISALCYGQRTSPSGANYVLGGGLYGHYTLP